MRGERRPLMIPSLYHKISNMSNDVTPVVEMMRSKEQKRNLKKYSKNHLHSKGKCAIIQQLYPCNAYGEVLKWSKRRDSKSRRALTRRVGSNPTFSARKKQVARLAFFYPSRRLGISSPHEVRCISSRAARRPCISSRASVHFPCDLMIYNASHW